MDEHAGPAQRLSYHLRKTLVPNAIMDGNSSLECIEGFMVLAPYAVRCSFACLAGEDLCSNAANPFVQDAGRHISLELTGTYLAVAHDRFKKLSKPKPDTDKMSTLYRRSYERLHLILFAYERGYALISGQTLGYLIPEPELASSLLQWAQENGATPADWDIAALCALRHAIVSLPCQVRFVCLAN